MDRFEITRSLFGRDITASVLRLDNSLQVSVYGGGLPHIGAVSIADPDGNVTTTQFSGHKDGAISESWAAAFAEAGYRPAVVTAGIHYDHLDREGIAAVLSTAGALLSAVFEKL